ncbi:probable serine/threonine-protein kinase DDB_G0283337 [Aethina tumida]|uniref:probable serine/threonine-protein kinase DDB_G0283337 n=1 Tax=Aethina tumida TaxID=116153 RepID=UPI00214889DF|nr:probable serine/threonine-protein kinase DDB_G0283337 [Aethina tumida]
MFNYNQQNHPTIIYGDRHNVDCGGVAFTFGACPNIQMPKAATIYPPVIHDPNAQQQAFQNIHKDCLDLLKIGSFLKNNKCEYKLNYNKKSSTSDLLASSSQIQKSEGMPDFKNISGICKIDVCFDNINCSDFNRRRIPKVKTEQIKNDHIYDVLNEEKHRDEKCVKFADVQMNTDSDKNTLKLCTCDSENKERNETKLNICCCQKQEKFTNKLEILKADNKCMLIKHAINENNTEYVILESCHMCSGLNIKMLDDKLKEKLICSTCGCFKISQTERFQKENNNSNNNNTANNNDKKDEATCSTCGCLKICEPDQNQRENNNNTDNNNNSNINNNKNNNNGNKKEEGTLTDCTDKKMVNQSTSYSESSVSNKNDDDEDECCCHQKRNRRKKQRTRGRPKKNKKSKNRSRSKLWSRKAADEWEDVEMASGSESENRDKMNRQLMKNSQNFDEMILKIHYG